jgi:uncharacterized protein
VILVPDFEFDEAKSRANAEKHGIDFHAAQDLWWDVDLLRVPARSGSEARFLFVGVIDGRHWAAIATYRGRTVRIISVRRARLEEVAAYERDGP